MVAKLTNGGKVYKSNTDIDRQGNLERKIGEIKIKWLTQCSENIHILIKETDNPCTELFIFRLKESCYKRETFAPRVSDSFL